jgi:hypothetical protein
VEEFIHGPSFSDVLSSPLDRQIRSGSLRLAFFPCAISSATKFRHQLSQALLKKTAGLCEAIVARIIIESPEAVQVGWCIGFPRAELADPSSEFVVDRVEPFKPYPCLKSGSIP